MKTCWKCKRSKPESEYHKDSTTTSGLSGKCKKCAKEVSQSFWELHTTVVVLRIHVEKVKEFIKSL